MVAINAHWQQHREDHIARLTQAAYEAVLQSGYRGSFLDLELSLWSAVRNAVDQERNPSLDAERISP